ncbi:MAG: hypothetical protein OXC10_14825 [Rhodospirillaceae bacterium]|nr:hypothetical protein [Rhodospirillaceae bacterium]
MGSVADKMAKKIAASRGSKVVDLASWRESRKMALEAGLGGEGPIPAKFADHDPCHGIYALAQDIASLMSESMSAMKEAKGFVRIAGEAENGYMPSGPPMSPLTVSYFTIPYQRPGEQTTASVGVRTCVPDKPHGRDRIRCCDAGCQGTMQGSSSVPGAFSWTSSSRWCCRSLPAFVRA